MTIHWICVGLYPDTPPCNAYGTTDKAAERHVKDTGHGVLTGVNPGALARAARAIEKESSL